MAGACQGESQWNIWNVFLLFHTGDAQPELTSSSAIDLSVPISKPLFGDVTPLSLLPPLESSRFSRPMKSSHCFGVRSNTSLVRFHSWSQKWLCLFSSSWVTKESPHGKIIARQTAQADLCPLVQNRIPPWEWSKLPFFSLLFSTLVLESACRKSIKSLSLIKTKIGKTLTSLHPF